MKTSRHSEDAAAKKISDARAKAFGSNIVPEPEQEPVKESPIPVNVDPTPREEEEDPQSGQPAAPPPRAAGTLRVMVNGQAQEIPADAKVVLKIDGQDQEMTVAQAL